MLLSNEVVISIIVLLALSLMRINVVIALIIAALTCGILGNAADGMALGEALSVTVKNFTGGLGGGAKRR